MTPAATLEGLRERASNLSPARFSHFVCLTDQLAEMRDWYMQLLNATVAYQDANLCFLRYDDEHHRIGLIRADALAPQPVGPSRMVHHCSFTYQDLGELLGTFLRLQGLGIEPFWCVNHGPTTSLYYKDPDGHRIELQVDNFTAAQCDAFFAGGAYVENPIGIIFDPDDWIRRLLDGEPVDAITVRPRLPADVSPFDMIRD